ncbi:MAG: SPASM domain-containing protein [Nanobdellota archaeon]
MEIKTITLVHKNCQRNCNICCYGGSSPVGYKKISQIVKILKKQGYFVHLFDFNINHESIEIFRKTKQFERSNPEWLNINPEFSPDEKDLRYMNSLKTNIVISLHGHNQKLHKYSSGKNDFNKIVNYIKKSHRDHIQTIGVNFVVNKKNKNHIKDMLDFAEKNLPINFVELIPLCYSGNAKKNLGEDSILTGKERYEIYKKIKENYGKYSFTIELDSIWGPDNPENKRKCWFFAPPLKNHYCNAGKNHIAIRLEDMKIFPCPCMSAVDEFSIGNFDGKNINIKNNLINFDKIKEPCASCEYFNICKGGCRLIAVSDKLVKTGTFDRHAGQENCLYLMKKLSKD